MAEGTAGQQEPQHQNPGWYFALSHTLTLIHTLAASYVVIHVKTVDTGLSLCQ